MDFREGLPVSGGLDEKVVARARRYAFHFFFRRMIPLRCLSERKDWPILRLNVRNLKNLLPGKDKGLDIICDGILRGKPFIYPAETEKHS